MNAMYDRKVRTKKEKRSKLTLVCVRDTHVFHVGNEKSLSKIAKAIKTTATKTNKCDEAKKKKKKLGHKMYETIGKHTYTNKLILLHT